MNRPKKISLTYEISRRCNLNCAFCYNAWKMDSESSRVGSISSSDDTSGQLSSRQTLFLLAKAIDEMECSDISLSGGEPLLREDIFDVISFLKKRNVKVSLITNGAFLTEDAIDKCLSSGLDTFQVTLLSDKPELHNRLAGGEVFDKAIEAILNIKKRNGTVYTFFVGLADNIHTFKGTMELNVLLGVSNVALGRFTPGGSGLRGWQNYMPAPDMIDGALRAADEISRKHRISVSVSTPILPCLNDISRYKGIRFAFCAVGNKDHSLFGIDPEGNLKVCSHSPHTLGNLLERPFEQLIGDSFLEDFISALPPFCRDCPEVSICRGGCRSSAHVCYGSLAEEDPYLKLWKARAKKPLASSFKTATGESTDDS
jgi:radical SAM protein with 4Fe4S-binding SPASM domain